MKINSFGIHIKCKDLDKSFNFYKLFGLKEVFAYGPQSFTEVFDFPTATEKYRGVIFGIGNSVLEIADGHIAVKSETFKEEINSPKISAMINTDSVKEVKNICLKNNIKISVDIKSYPWGTKELVIKDPDGFVLVFIEKN